MVNGNLSEKGKKLQTLATKKDNFLLHLKQKNGPLHRCSERNGKRGTRHRKGKKGQETSPKGGSTLVVATDNRNLSFTKKKKRQRKARSCFGRGPSACGFH